MKKPSGESRPRNRPFAFLFGGLALLVSATTLDAQTDNRLYLPFDVIKETPGLQVAGGIDHDALGLIGGAKDSPFSDSFIAQVSERPRSSSEWSWEFIEDIYQMSRESAFAVQADAKSPFFKVAVEVNGKREKRVDQNTVRITAFTRFETGVKALPDLAAIPESELSDSVRAMLKEFREASEAVDLDTQAQIRSRFRRAHGTGFIQQVTKGGLFFITLLEKASTEEEKSSLRSEISAELKAFAGSGSASASSSSSTGTTSTRRFAGINGRFEGGDPSVAKPDFAGFQKTAEKWFESVKAKGEVLEAIFIPYSEVESLRPLSTLPAKLVDLNTSLLGYFGPVDRPDSGAFVAINEAHSPSIGSVPLLQAVSGSVNAPRRSFGVLFTADPGLARPVVDYRQTLWRPIASEQVGSLATAAEPVTDPRYLERVFVAPEIEVRSEQGEVLDRPRFHFAPGEDAAGFQPVAVYVDAEAAQIEDLDKPGHFEIRFSTEGHLERFLRALEEGRVFLRTLITADFVSVLRSEGRQLGVVAQADDTSRWTFAYPGVVARSEAERFDATYDALMGERLRAALHGPAKDVLQRFTPGPQLTKGYWDGGGMHVPLTCPGAARAVPAGYEYVGYEERTYDQRGCVGQDCTKSLGCKEAALCNGAGEFCITTYRMKSGCIVNSDWVRWYKALAVSLNLRTDDEALCR